MPHVRCCNCGGRRTLSLHPDQYVRQPPNCTRCRSSNRWRVDRYRDRVECGGGAKPCKCYGYSFPHRLGSKWCDNNPALTADDLRDRHESGRYS